MSKPTIFFAVFVDANNNITSFRLLVDTVQPTVELFYQWINDMDERLMKTSPQNRYVLKHIAYIQ